MRIHLLGNKYRKFNIFCLLGDETTTGLGDVETHELREVTYNQTSLLAFKGVLLILQEGILECLNKVPSARAQGAAIPLSRGER